MGMPENYLIEDFDVRYNTDYLKTKDDIIDYFMKICFNEFDCGQDYYENEASLIAMTQDEKFYRVSIFAEISSAKQEKGGILYWIKKIALVLYIEIEKPVPKERRKTIYELYLTQEEKKYCDNLLLKYQV